MPTYEYICHKCGHQFDHFQPMTELPLKKCPLCKGKVERLISGGGGLIFKGSGFYINDYARSEDYKKKTKEESTSTIVSNPSSEKKESKPAAEPAKKPKKATESK